jgi:arginase
MSSKISVFGSAFKHGQRLKGVDKAPHVLRKLGLVETLMEGNNNIIDSYNIYYPNSIPDNRKKLGHYSANMAEMIYNERQKGNKILNIGGDHSVAIGSVNGILHNNPDTIIIWVDAHGDINTEESSSTGNAHGMPVSYLTGLENSKTLSSSKYLSPKLQFNQLVYIGIRDLDPPEETILTENEILHYQATSVKEHGVIRIMDEIMTELNPMGEKEIYLSFDIDALDPAEAPGTGVKANDGLSSHDAHDICEYLSNMNCVGMDMVEINPDLDIGHRTSKLGISLIKTVFG